MWLVVRADRLDGAILQCTAQLLAVFNRAQWWQYMTRAVEVADIVFRRSSIGSAECPDRGVLEQLADIMAAKLDWDEETRTAEIDSIYRHIRPLHQP